MLKSVSNQKSKDWQSKSANTAAKPIPVRKAHLSKAACTDSKADMVNRHKQYCKNFKQQRRHNLTSAIFVENIIPYLLSFVKIFVINH